MGWPEAKWIVDQINQKLGVYPNNMRMFDAYPTSKSIIALKFLEPADSRDSDGNITCIVGGVMIRMSQDGYPMSPSAGTLVIDNKEPGKYQEEPFEVSDLTEGEEYFFSAFPYSVQGVYNQSTDPANRVSSTPNDGEQVTVNVTIDDPEGFTAAVIKCVDETDQESTASVTVTPQNSTARFSVSPGHKYHLEYGPVEKYIASDTSTETQTAVAGATRTYDVTYTYYTATINVTYPEGATATCEKGGTKYTAPNTSGSWTVKVHEAGGWTVKAFQEDADTQDTVTISEHGKTQAVTLKFFTATINVTHSLGATVTCELNDIKYTNQIIAPDISKLWTVTVHKTGSWRIEATQDGREHTTEVEISKDGEEKSVIVSTAPRYGYQKTKNEGNPEARITYLYEAEGIKPAKMNYDEDKFDYGDWEDIWFVKKNIPVMLKNDCTVDYELNHNNQTLKMDGSKSDVSNENYNGNAMSALPLCWFHRYEDTEYEYEIVCEEQYDENYKAYAHTRADGSIADYVYWSMFGGSLIGEKVRSLKGKALKQELATDNQVSMCRANGDGWDVHSWSRREYIRTLLVLMGKSTDTQRIFGVGNIREKSWSSVTPLLETGTLSDKGRFYGTTENNKQVKVFFIEGFWGDQSDLTLGAIINDNTIMVKMTPEGDGYSLNDFNKYENTGITLQKENVVGLISRTKCSKLGVFPVEFNGSNSTFECSTASFYYPGIKYFRCGSSVEGKDLNGGAFAMSASQGNMNYWAFGCGITADMPVEGDRFFKKKEGE